MEKIIEIPEGYKARIEGNKVVIGPKESEGERIIERLLEYFRGFYDRFSCKNNVNVRWEGLEVKKVIAYLEKQKKQKEQKPAEWSADDRAMLLATIEYIQAYPVRLPSVVRWLESLPERFNLPPKQEWSGEDEEMLRIISNRLDKFSEWATEQGFPIDDPTMKQSPIEWLKSRRPRPQWKPTDEQMEWLEQAVRLSANTLRTHDIILSLYNDLKKLM